MPVSGERCSSNFVKASRPPAEAPMPTIGNDWLAAGSSAALSSEASGLNLDSSDLTGAPIAVFCRCDAGLLGGPSLRLAAAGEARVDFFLPIVSSLRRF